MLAPDFGGLSDLPVWVWPYIDVARLARGEVRAAGQHSALAATPAIATATRLATVSGVGCGRRHPLRNH
jgi:hypothetical protein